MDLEQWRACLVGYEWPYSSGWFCDRVTDVGLDGTVRVVLNDANGGWAEISRTVEQLAQTTPEALREEIAALLPQPFVAEEEVE